MFNRLAKLRAERARGEHGFTLIELLVVVVIIGVLIAVAIPLYLNYRKGANDKAAQSDLRNAINVLEQCNTDNTSYPTAVDDDGGSLASGGCTGQAINLSANTKLRYVVASGNYTLYTENSEGTKVYCYNSAAGGAVKTAAGTTGMANATCP